MENQNLNNPAIPPQGAEVPEQSMLPHSIAVLITGISSIQLAFIYGIPGLACSIVALILGNKSGSYILQNPGLYTEGSLKMYRAGRTCAIIGLILSIVMIFAFIFLFYYLFTSTSHHYQPHQPPPPPSPPDYR
jgi:hypothetical protein